MMAMTALTMIVAVAGPQHSRYILVRHCEKEKLVGEADPGLSVQGQERARALARLLESEKVDAVYATPYKRTQATVQPFAVARRLAVSIVKGTNDKAFAEQLLAQHRGQSVLIASHVNVIPDLVRFLGVPEPLELDEAAYGDMFIVDVDAQGKTTLTHARFGE